jgi:MoaA/NifB/PqqE/SkfB family radical SAM enzyme
LSDNDKSALQKALSADWNRWLSGAADYNIRSRFQVLPPTIFQFVTNYRCNARCAMCNIWQAPHKHEMTAQELAALMDPDPLFDSVEDLLVMGGESSLRSDFVDIVAYLVRRLPKARGLSLVTNGFLPKRILEQTEAILGLIESKKIKLSMSVSLDGIGALHDQVRGIPGAFDKALETIAGLQALQKRHDFWLGVGYVLMHQNLRQAQELREWAEARGLDVSFQMVAFHDTYISNQDRQGDVDFRPEDRDDLIVFMQQLAGERSLTNWAALYWSDMVRMYRDGAPRMTPCPFAMDGVALDAYGDVYYCLSSPKIGNVNEEKRSVGEIYHDPKNLRFRAAELRQRMCPGCNSGCGVGIAIKKDVKKYLKFLVTGR